METGNPKQVAVLAVMAVGAVGFLFTRLGGKPNHPSVATTAPHAATPRSLVAATLSRDPFSHPHLAPKPIAIPKLTVASPENSKPSFVLTGSLPSAAESTSDPRIISPAGPLESKKNLESKPVAAASTTIGLEAIAGASDAVAFLTVDHAESRPFHPSEIVSGAVRLLSVSDGEVVLSSPKGKLTLGVGERKTL